MRPAKAAHLSALSWPELTTVSPLRITSLRLAAAPSTVRGQFGPALAERKLQLITEVPSSHFCASPCLLLPAFAALVLCCSSKRVCPYGRLIAGQPALLCGVESAPRKGQALVAFRKHGLLALPPADGGGAGGGGGCHRHVSSRLFTCRALGTVLAVVCTLAHCLPVVDGAGAVPHAAAQLLILSSAICHSRMSSAGGSKRGTTVGQQALQARLNSQAKGGRRGELCN